jgi:hypothetical protein
MWGVEFPILGQLFSIICRKSWAKCPAFNQFNSLSIPSINSGIVGGKQTDITA